MFRHLRTRLTVLYAGLFAAILALIAVLQYPLAEAMAPYRMLGGLLIAAGAVGFLVFVVGAWALARTVTRPISSLDEAARRLQRGERPRVEARTRDEIGRLAESFNAMAAEISQREEELVSTRDQAEAANRAKSSFLKPAAGATDETEVASPEPLPTRIDDERGVRVLVVDDHETNRAVARLILEGAGVEVVCAADGEQAVGAWLGGGFDLVLMDMQMPVMDGLEAIRRIRAHEQGSGGARTPIYMLSANAMPEHMEASRAAGADGHLAKPIAPQRLIAALAQALDAAAEARTGETRARQPA